MNSFEELKKLLEQGVSLGLNLKDQIEKVEQVVNSLNSDTIRNERHGAFIPGRNAPGFIGLNFYHLLSKFHTYPCLTPLKHLPNKALIIKRDFLNLHLTYLL